MKRDIDKKVLINILGLFLLFSFVNLCSSCAKQDREILVAQQIKDIESFAQSAANASRRLVINSGSTRLVISEGAGDTLAVGDSVTFDYAGYIFQSGLGTLFDTNVESISEVLGVNIYNRGFDCGDCVLGRGKLIKGLDLGLIGAKKGEQAYIVFPADLGFGNSDIGLVPKMSALIYEVWIKEIKKN